MRQKENQIIGEPGKKKTMNCLEIITVRGADKDDFEKALKLCAQVSPAVEIGELVNLNVYRSSGYGSDLSIHIHWVLESFSPRKSLLGLHIAKGLNELGLVSHTLWIDQHIIAGKNT